MKGKQCENYRNRLKGRSRNGGCGANLNCNKAPQLPSNLCEEHLKIKNIRQKERRKQAEIPQSQRGSLDIAGRFRLPSQASAPPFPLDAPEPCQKLIWVTFPDENALEETTTLAIQVFFNDHEILGHDPWLTQACSMTLRNTIVSSSDAGHYIHQGLVTLLATQAEAKNVFSVEGHTWDWLDQQLPGKLLYSSCTDEHNEPLRSVLFLHWTTNEPINPSLDEIYSAVRLLKNIHPTSFRVYPNEHEARQERDKLGDIRALDDTAKSSPDRFFYRPKTCYGHCRCSLENEKQTVHKRTKSGCATHVYVRKHGEQHQLTRHREAHALKAPSQKAKRRGKKQPKTPKQSKVPADGADISAHWFHQEFVPSLPKCEFRVFIATEPSEKGIRGRIGKVIAVAKTAFDPNTQALAARQFQESDLEPPLQRSHLFEFALFVFEALRARPDSMLVFESLEVGVRLDIGVADTETVGKTFFVNEITRWYGAHYFSNNLCAEPKTQICKAFASAFSAFLTGHIP